MTTTEKLNKIKAECERLLIEREDLEYLAEAGWRSTITAIDYYLESNEIGQGFLYQMICGIITEWEGLV